MAARKDPQKNVAGCGLFGYLFCLYQTGEGGFYPFIRNSLLKFYYLDSLSQLQAGIFIGGCKRSIKWPVISATAPGAKFLLLKFDVVLSMKV